MKNERFCHAIVLDTAGGFCTVIFISDHPRLSVMVNRLTRPNSTTSENSLGQWLQRVGENENEVDPLAKVRLRGRAIILLKGCNRKLSFLKVVSKSVTTAGGKKMVGLVSCQH